MTGGSAQKSSTPDRSVMSDRPAVSVIMPVYKTEAYLAEAVRSVLEQDFTDFELLVVDDGSPGDVRGILAGFDDARIRYLHHENRGPGYTRNRGIRESTGRYVAFLDSDDAWMPHKLSIQVAALDAAPQYDVVYSQRETMDGHGRTVAGYTPVLHSGDVLDELYVDSFICMSSAMVRRGVFAVSGYIAEDLRISQDYDFWLRVACHHRFLAVDEPLVRYRVHGTQVSRQVEERVRVVWQIYERFNREHGHRVSPRARRRSRASFYNGRADRCLAAGKRLQAAGCYLRAMVFHPLDNHPWKGCVRVLLPAPLQRLARQLLRR